MRELSRVRGFFQKNFNKINFFHIEMSRVSRLFQSNWQTKKPKINLLLPKSFSDLAEIRKKKRQQQNTSYVVQTRKLVCIFIFLIFSMGLNIIILGPVIHIYFLLVDMAIFVFFFFLYSSYSFRNLWLVPWTPWTVMRGISYADKLVSCYVLLWVGWRGEPAITDLN